MYFLRKEPYERVIKKAGGQPEIIKYESDRAIFKHKRYSRMYRMDFRCTDKDVRLWKVKNLQTILQERVRLWYYCSEWFDIYDENGKINADAYSAYKPKAFYTAKTTRTLYYSEEEGEIVDDKPAYGYYETYRSGTILKIYRWLDWYEEWDCYPDYTERIKKENQLVAVTNSGKHLFTFIDDQDLLEENCWFEIVY